jgi:misacylated tRNA(Ala) deacylase
VTALLYREDAYLKTCAATIAAVEDGAIVLNQTVFYATGGGQKGDSGILSFAAAANKAPIEIAEAVFGEGGKVRHLCADKSAAAAKAAPGEAVMCEINWQTRHARMRAHTALHLLCACVSAPVTGGAVGDGRGRIDFDLANAPPREELEERLNALVAADLPINSRWISEAELDANPALIKTMSVRPPRGAGKIRLIEIKDADIQACGGTHIKSTAEIGKITVAKIEKKGRQNRRIVIVLQ